MRIAICDDDPSDLKTVYKYVNRFVKENMLEVEINCFSSGESMLRQYRYAPYDLLLLDIYMDSQSGIDIARTLRETNNTCEIIFITNSLDHALESYRLKAIEYLVKPVSWEEAEKALQRCCSRFVDSSRYIEVKCGRKVEHIRLRTILSVEVYGHQSVFHTLFGDFRTRTSLDEIETMLGGLPFFRISRSYLVNFKKTDRLEKDGFYLVDGSFIPVPVRANYRKAVQQTYQTYLFEQSDKGRFPKK